MKTLIRLTLLLLVVLGVLYFFTFRVRGRRVEIEKKATPGFHEVSDRAKEIEKKAREAVVSGEKKIEALRHEPAGGAVEKKKTAGADEPTDEDRQALTDLLKKKLKQDDRESQPGRQ